MTHRQSSFTPQARPGSIVSSQEPGSTYRFTLLTEALVRYEYSTDGRFEDRASTFVVNRALPTPAYRVLRQNDCLQIITSKFHLTYAGGPFSANSLTVQVLGGVTNWKSRWRYGESAPNLGGTSRTLDDVDGRMPLEPGVLSRTGFANIDDSTTMLFDGEWVTGREAGRVDGYLFAHGSDYAAAMRDYFAISGPAPLLPRWALGNWWSRFYPYSEKEYLELMDKFAEYDVPLSVAVIDVDWHLNHDERVQSTGSSGWTGYTWNDKLFPNPKRFMAELRKRRLRVTLNDHPADGIYSFEDSYVPAARSLGLDPATKESIPFDPASKDFMDTFFDVVRRPVEKQGADFWWCDWQQGKYSRIPGVDPLWVLNHYSFLDNSLGRRPLHFSRYAGPGSHRYPVGFSGDTIVSWDSLRFQPEYTASSSNVGYGWWSHDIGGHRDGKRDEELVTRWVQFGVFSPIMRLHSSCGLWTSKEPWSFNIEYSGVLARYMRLRHRMLPYLYTMNVRSARGTPLCTPMYWQYPTLDAAYTVPNQYFFGSQLIVAPITEPRVRVTGRAGVKIWLPKGRYVDIFTGAIYDGGRHLNMYRAIGDYPVLAREGAIIPLDAKDSGNGCEQVDSFEVLLVVGSDGEFELCEDDDGPVETMGQRSTRIAYDHSARRLEIHPTERVAGLPDEREWKIRLLSSTPTNIQCSVDGKDRQINSTTAGSGMSFSVGKVPCGSRVLIDLGEKAELAPLDLHTQLQPIVHEAQIEFALKQDIWDVLDPALSQAAQVSRLLVLPLEKAVMDCVLEILLAQDR